jgi:hypothetical protein
MRALLILAALLAIAPAQDPPEIKLSWDLPEKSAADYTVSELRGGKAFLRPDRSFVLFPADLNPDGTCNITVNTCLELPLRVALRLPPGPVRPGARWKVEEDFFESGRNALTRSHCYTPLGARGFQNLVKIEPMGGRDCARIETTAQFFELKFDSKERKDLGRTAVSSMSAVAWFSLEGTVPVRIQTSFSGRVSEFRGIKQGEEPKNSKTAEALQFDLKKDYVKLDLVATRESVHDAIKRGAEWLKKARERNGSWIDSGGSFAREFPVGSTALCLTALLHAGVPKDDPVVREALALVQRADLRHVYDVGASLMALEAKYLPLEQYEEVVELTEEKARKAILEKMTREDSAWLQRAVDWLLARQRKDGTWGYPAMAWPTQAQYEDYYDHSNTQYALLGLKSAARCGAKIPSKVWRHIAEHWIEAQKPSAGPKVELKIAWTSATDRGVEVRAEEQISPGAWGYWVRPLPGLEKEVPDRGYGSMVCAGLTSLIIAQSELVRAKDMDEALKSRMENAKRTGLAWLQANYSVRGCPPSAGFWSVFYLYYLYSLERVGVLYGIREIGGHDWYLEGAVLLIRDQRPDGGWESYDEIPVVDTAFALLFLKKATLKVVTK